MASAQVGVIWECAHTRVRGVSQPEAGLCQCWGMSTPTQCRERGLGKTSLHPFPAPAPGSRQPRLDPGSLSPHEH